MTNTWDYIRAGVARVIMSPPSPVEKDVLVALLKVGDHTIGGLSDATSHDPELSERSPESLSRALSRLSEQPHPAVESKGYGVWTLTDAGQRTAQSIVRQQIEGDDDGVNEGADDR